ncbi:hypothetical protein [Bacillus sp. T33-2]|uniref:hypothetical protein n=1 Tax=Bacillus sp. T33-2 TaxID=2054168 RepID=UPI000C7949C9|nr:hypothetical protein [Bacillus sp. T33-2]PLR92651.1 hypothetical protein CVD19_20560 [Bacillus sp. T33-2]
MVHKWAVCGLVLLIMLAGAWTLEKQGTNEPKIQNNVTLTVQDARPGSHEHTVFMPREYVKIIDVPNDHIFIK